MKIDQVPRFWRNNTPARSFTTNFWTDGKDLYSYNLKIGTTYNNEKHIFDYTTRTNNFISATTSRHVNLAAFYADQKIDPS
tara:strand:+ start:284 stop:526 length:243 start_codon:yes stop_codon:yes gene_type:complete